MKTIALLGLLLGSFGFVLQAQTPSPADLLKFHFQSTNNVPISTSLIASSPDGSTNRIPIIQFNDVPISTGIGNLARQAGINVLLQPGIYKEIDGGTGPEPFVTLEWRGITARDALDRLCYEHDLKLVDDPWTHIVHITCLGEPKYFIDGKVLGLTTNQPDTNSYAVIPLIEFWEVPLDIAFMNLIRQSGRSIELNFKATDKGQRFNPMPEVFVRWESVTCEQCILALCEAYDLELVTDPATGNLQIAPRKFKRRHRV
jgi:hypothetical protein